MNRPSQTLLAPLLAVLAMLLALTGNASAAFNYAATEPHYGNFSLWETEASRVFGYEEAHPTREIGEWIYDDASGVPVYVRQNPWSAFDPLGLDYASVAPAVGSDGKFSGNFNTINYKRTNFISRILGGPGHKRGGSQSNASGAEVRAWMKKRGYSDKAINKAFSTIRGGDKHVIPTEGKGGGTNEADDKYVYHPTLGPIRKGQGGGLAAGDSPDGLSGRDIKKLKEAGEALPEEDSNKPPTPRKKSSKQLRKEWEEAHDEKWPQNEQGRNHDADHDDPLGDGGEDHGGTNVTPRTRKDHVERHKKNGDFSRWAKRRKKKKEGE